MISIVLIDDHPLAIKGIGEWLSSTGRFAITGTAKNLSEAIAMLKNISALPRIIILDVSLGDEDGLELIPELKSICEDRNQSMPEILVCSMYEDPFLIQRAIDSGAKAYVPKTTEPDEILKAIDTLLEGGVYINPKYMINKPKNAWSILTSRENEIVTFLKRSLSPKQIAKRLNISLRTVENHLAHIYAKTDTTSRDELTDL